MSSARNNAVCSERCMHNHTLSTLYSLTHDDVVSEFLFIIQRINTQLVFRHTQLCLNISIKQILTQCWRTTRRVYFIFFPLLVQCLSFYLFYICSALDVQTLCTSPQMLTLSYSTALDITASWNSWVSPHLCLICQLFSVYHLSPPW